MKKIYILILALTASIAAFADKFQYDGIWYETLSDNTCQTAADPYMSIEYGPNQWNPSQYEWKLVTTNPNLQEWEKQSPKGPNTFNWKTPGELPSYAYDGNKKYEVVGIGDFSFAGAQAVCTSELILPPTLKFIGKGAFALNTQGNMDKELTLKNLESIGDFAFFGATWFRNFSFENIDYIGQSAFQNMNNLTYDVVFTNVKEIGPKAFFGCGFKSVTVNNDYCDGVIDESAFEGNSLSDIVLNGVKTVGNRAFYETDPLTITIGDCTQTIEDSAFYGSRRTTSLSLGKNLQWIGDYAFYDCSVLDELTIPDSCLHIGNYAFYNCVKICPVDFGKGLQWIGDYAFWNAHWDCSNIIDLPASLKHIGVWGFMFNRTADVRETDTDITDIYIHAVKPPELPVDERGHCAWGDLDVNLAGFWDVDGMWMFPYLCLHVPQGSRSDYESHPYWGKFKCIIDDLLPEDGLTADPEDPDNDGKGSIQNIVGYVFISIAPNETNAETLTLSKDLFPTSTIDVDEWVLYNDKNIVKFKEGSKDVIQPLALGEQLILGYNNTLNETWDNGKKDWVKERSLVGAVMVFVCPTITLVYDNDLQTNTPVVSSRSNNRALSSVGDPAESSSDYEGVISQNASYQHTVVYNSYPKVELLEPAGVHFEVLQKGHFDENGTWTNDYSQLEEVDEDTQRVGPGAETEGNYVVPNTSITENRVLKINTSIDEYTLGTTIVANIEVNNRISLSANGRTITINGADDSDVVKIYDLKGVLLYNTTDKTITLSAPGVYIINIDGENIKAQVR